MLTFLGHSYTHINTHINLFIYLFIYGVKIAKSTQVCLALYVNNKDKSISTSLSHHLASLYLLITHTYLPSENTIFFIYPTYFIIYLANNQTGFSPTQC